MPSHKQARPRPNHRSLPSRHRRSELTVATIRGVQRSLVIISYQGPIVCASSGAVYKATVMPAASPNGAGGEPPGAKKQRRRPVNGILEQEHVMVIRADLQYSVCDLSSEKGMLFDVFYDGTALAWVAFDLIVL